MTAAPAAVPVLETPRLRLRGLEPGDAEALHPTLSDPASMTWWSHAPFATLAETQAHLDRETPGWRAWYFAPREGGPALGFVAVGEKRNGPCELGYLLARDRHGAGLAFEAVARVLDHLFGSERRRRVFADTDPDNNASRRLLERLGFTLEGRLRGEWETHIGVRDSLIYGLLREEWVARVPAS
ncbi:GNAT family N-acetyltransferase [Sphingomonas sp. ac-8]|uniref:GNAT family N-acetyltransferase n=1 Tax=Sphingomonas sp. ac-8 TaxID=3242977 RepID=UPI003A80561E